MEPNDLGKGIGTLGIAAAVIVAVYITKNPSCLWGLVTLILIW